MALSPELVERLEAIARDEKRPVDEVVRSMLEQYEPKSVGSPLDADARFQQQYREFRQKLYNIARDYWRREGNAERLALTDAQLDEQFWLIDHEGIPRLKSEEGTIDLPPDPLDLIDGLFADSDVMDASTSVRETLARRFGREEKPV